jgi:ABC-2 type transport system permease protein
MIYSYTMVGERFGSFAPYYLLNPIADAVLLMQRAFWTGTVEGDPGQPADFAAQNLPDHLILRGFVMVGVCVVLLGLAQLAFRAFERKIPERI